ncbi:MAG: hypothetical protein IH948_02765 [Bacteroidetes bacterium]|nr:hypothetical protein [Bacteroidota bacterium]
MRTAEAVSNTIRAFARRENQKLMHDFGKGIFDVPELAFVYLVGKEIAGDFEGYFNSKDYDWVRETDFGNGGPTDLAFWSKNPMDTSYMLEFKMDDTHDKYTADIRKLKQPLLNKYQDRKVEKYFCGLKWVFEHQVDEFTDILKKEFGSSATLITSEALLTSINGEMDKHYCLFTFWMIDE